MPKKRKILNRELKSRFHIFCEGEKTEPYYFRYYLDLRHPGILVSIPKIEENTPVQLVEKAILLQNNNPSGDQFWVVFDRESENKYSKKLHDQALLNARKHDINIALSNVCFEIWILLHFTRNVAAYDNFDDLKKRSPLKIYIPDYDKAMRHPFSIEQINVARKNALQMNQATENGADPSWNQPHQWNPYTDVYKLLDVIDAFAKE